MVYSTYSIAMRSSKNAWIVVNLQKAMIGIAIEVINAENACKSEWHKKKMCGNWFCSDRSRGLVWLYLSNYPPLVVLL